MNASDDDAIDTVANHLHEYFKAHDVECYVLLAHAERRCAFHHVPDESAKKIRNSDALLSIAQVHRTRFLSLTDEALGTPLGEVLRPYGPLYDNPDAAAVEPVAPQPPQC